MAFVPSGEKEAFDAHQDDPGIPVCGSHLPSPQAIAQGFRGGGAGGGGWGPGSQYGRMYDPQTVGTTDGEIIKVEKITPMSGMSRGVHVVLKTDKSETVSVHLGPEWYIDKQEITFKPGDKVQVRGSRITFEGKPAIIAAEVTKDGRTLQLRGTNGVPVWAGGRGQGR